MSAAAPLLARLGVGLALLLPRAEALRLLGWRRVLFTGDSTIRFQFEMACGGDKRRIWRTHAYRKCTAAEDADLLYVDYLKPSRATMRVGPGAAVDVFQQATGQPPEVVYMNTYGLWSLHLEPALVWGRWADLRANYTVHLSKSLWQLQARGVRAVVFMSTHRVCEGNFYGLWHLVATNSSGWSLKKGCDSYLADKCPGVQYHTCDADLGLLCGTSALTHAGSARIAEEEAATVAGCRAAGLRVGLVDGHAISAAAGCGHTQDGRHYDAGVIREELAALDGELQELGEEPFVSSLHIRAAPDRSENARVIA